MVEDNILRTSGRMFFDKSVYKLVPSRFRISVIFYLISNPSSASNWSRNLFPFFRFSLLLLSKNSAVVLVPLIDLLSKFSESLTHSIFVDKLHYELALTTSEDIYIDELSLRKEVSYEKFNQFLKHWWRRHEHTTRFLSFTDQQFDINIAKKCILRHCNAFTADVNCESKLKLFA